MNKVLPLLIVLAFAGCKKDNDATGLLTRSWQITAIRVGNTISSSPNSCIENRIWTFQKDGSFLSEPSPNCTPGGADFIINGTWNLVDNKTLKIEGGGSLEAQIVLLTKSRLVLRREANLGGGGGSRLEETIFEFASK